MIRLDPATAGVAVLPRLTRGGLDAEVGRDAAHDACASRTRGCTHGGRVDLPAHRRDRPECGLEFGGG
jgi:hypothetical protein